MSETVTFVETIDEFKKRKGTLSKNDTGRITSRTARTVEHKGHGYIRQIGKVNIPKNADMQFVRGVIAKASVHARIIEYYPTHYCSNCHRSCWQFAIYERQGHATCRGCGMVQKIAQNNIKLYLGEDGTASKTQWEITPGMTANDSYLRNKRGNRMEIAGQRPKSHLRHMWGILKKVEMIADEWHFSAIERLIRSAKFKVKKLYRCIHYSSEDDDDNQRKMPHGVSSLAAACFYVAVLEFEAVTHSKTMCTLPAIQESAQASRDTKRGRKVRDVTDVKILEYARMLKRFGLCSVKIPHINAETLRFHPKSAALEHARLAIFNECQPVRFYLPMTTKWGMKVGDTNQGVLYVESVSTDAAAFKAGIRKGDHIFQIVNHTLDINYTPNKFARLVGEMRKKLSNKPVMEITIMRTRKK
jgi:hypothetical protein